MLALLLAAATSASAVALTPPALIYNPGSQDIEMRTNGSRASGEVVYALTIAPNGRVQGCKVVGSSGSPRLDSLSCQNASRNLRFRGAHDAQGQPAYSVVRHSMVWSDGYVSSGPRTPGADVILKVGRMPAEWAKAPAVRVDFVVGADGAVGSCVSAAEAFVRMGGSDAGEPQASLKDERMARAACAALPKAFEVTVARDAAGKAVPSVQSANVIFEDGSASPAKG
jgi:TonB family protein